MATTKALLERTIQKIGSNCINRDTTFTPVEITIDQTSTSWQSYTPPCDGFIQLNAYGASESDAMNLKDGYGKTIENVIRATSSGFAQALRAHKGGTMLFRFYQSQDSRRLLFMKSIGGGLRLFLETLERGRLLCLRLSPSLMQRLRQEVSSLSSMPQEQELDLKLLRGIGTFLQNTLHLRTECLLCSRKLQQNCIAMVRSICEWGLLAIRLRSISVYQSLFAKGKQFLASLGTARALDISTPTIRSFALEGGF